LLNVDDNGVFGTFCVTFAPVTDNGLAPFPATETPFTAFPATPIPLIARLAALTGATTNSGI